MKNQSIINLLTEEQIFTLINNTTSCEKGWNRICLHSNSQSKMHCMVMCMLPKIESGFHSHKFNSELITYSFIRGVVTIKARESNDIKSHQILKLSRESPILSLPDTCPRSVSNTTLTPIVYLEHRLGPYNQEDIKWD